VTLVSLGVKVARVLIGAAAVVVVLSALGYPIASLVAGLGIGGLALALAAQKTGEHLFGTLAIGIDQPFRVGDWVKVDDQEGTVEAVGLRSTRIRTLDRTLISIPNGKLADMRSEQVSARDRYRVHASLTVAFGTPPDTLRALMTELRAVLAAHPKAHTDGPWVFLRRVGDSGMEVEVSAWFACDGYEAFLQLRSEVLLSVLDRVERAGVTLAYPTRTVLLHGTPTAR
jgi:MscS family membrane protein